MCLLSESARDGYLGIDRTSAPIPGEIEKQTVKAYIAEHAYNQLTQVYWLAPIDDRLSGKRCLDCELKYACSSCRYTDPEAS